jgi:membrane protein
MERLKRIGRRFVGGIIEDDVGGLAAEIAYRFLFAVFPFVLFVAAVAAFIANWLPIENPAGQIVALLGDNLPGPIAESLRPELERLIASPRADLLSFGAIAALWAATGGTNTLIKGMHRAYDAPEARPFWRRYLVALFLTGLAAMGVILSFVAIVGGALVTQGLAEQVGLGREAFNLLQLLRWPAVFGVMTFSVGFLYRFAPNVIVPWRWVLVGSAAFSLAFLVTTATVGFYAVNVADFGATYGSLGGVIVLMLWFYVTALVLLLGAELSAACAREWTPDEVQRATPEADLAAEAAGEAMAAGEATTAPEATTAGDEEAPMSDRQHDRADPDDRLSPPDA